MLDEGLESSEVSPIEWDDGVRGGCAGDLTFAAGPVRGWVMVVSDGPLYDPYHSLEARLVRLSERFGDAQAFASEQSDRR